MDFTNTPAQFIFPVLKSADILQCMTELGIEMTKAELTEPHRHKDKVKGIFLQLVRSRLSLYGCMMYLLYAKDKATQDKTKKLRLPTNAIRFLPVS